MFARPLILTLFVVALFAVWGTCAPLSEEQEESRGSRVRRQSLPDPADAAERVKEKMQERLDKARRLAESAKERIDKQKERAMSVAQDMHEAMESASATSGGPIGTTIAGAISEAVDAMSSVTGAAS